MYDKNSNTMPYRFHVETIWCDEKRKRNFQTVQQAKNYLATLDYNEFSSVSLFDRQNKIEIKYIGTNVEIYVQGKFAGDVATTFDDTGAIYAFTTIAHSPSGERTVSRDFVAGEHPMGVSDHVLKLLAIEWVQTQHANLALEEL